MRTYTKEELAKILKEHGKWLDDPDTGTRADLRSADLRSADLRWANLRSANLSSANLRSANLRSANLRWADLSSADLSSADLRSANLSSADLRWANLRWANLRSANLRSANLRWADLRSADLLCFTFNRDTAYFVFDSKVRVGCEYLPIDTWLSDYIEIGKKYSYSDIEIEAYGTFIQLCAKLQKQKDASK